MSACIIPPSVSEGTVLGRHWYEMLEANAERYAVRSVARLRLQGWRGLSRSVGHHPVIEGTVLNRYGQETLEAVVANAEGCTVWSVARFQDSGYRACA